MKMRRDRRRVVVSFNRPC